MCMEIHQSYAEELAKAVSKLPLEEIYDAAVLLSDNNENAGTVIIAGNGGSASTASHISCDLQKNTSDYLLVNCLNDNMALLTAYANDVSYNDIFVEMLASANVHTCVCVLISTSGESENIVRLANKCYDLGIFMIGLMGANKESRLAKLVNLPIHIESDNIGVVEDLHLSIGHIWTELLRSW